MTDGEKVLGGRTDPDGNFRFIVEIDGITQAGFAEVIMPVSYTDVIEYRAGNDPSHVSKLAGLTKYSNLILSWGITDSMELYEWRRQVEEGKMKEARRNLSVVLLDEEGNECARWNFTEAWPVGYSAPDLTAEGVDVAIETLEITFQRMERVS
jgi:phage tail-like protein